MEQVPPLDTSVLQQNQIAANDMANFYRAAQSAGFGNQTELTIPTQEQQQQVHSFVRTIPSPRNETPQEEDATAKRTVIYGNRDISTLHAANNVETLHLYTPDGVAVSYPPGYQPPMSYLPQTPVSKWGPPDAVTAASMAFAQHPQHQYHTMAPQMGMEAYYAAVAQQQQLASGLMPYMGYAPPYGSVAIPSIKQQAPINAENAQVENSSMQPNEGSSMAKKKRGMWCPCNTVAEV